MADPQFIYIELNIDDAHVPGMGDPSNLRAGIHWTCTDLLRCDPEVMELLQSLMEKLLTDQ